MQTTACINGVEYAVIGEVKAPSGAMVIVLDMPMMKDITMQRMSLLERLRRPDVYATIENVPEAVNHLEMWLEVNALTLKRGTLNMNRSMTCLTDGFMGMTAATRRKAAMQNENYRNQHPRR